MLDALARSIAETAADVLGARAAQTCAKVSDEQIGLYLWHERGFRDHDTLVALINHAREILDHREAQAIARHRRPRSPRKQHPPATRETQQLDLALVAA
ncbi:hypothetical protein [Methylobacterium sp. 37f]|uniref:hypothetical protein n=1 Tax=Methylobacterium sp. 37f TaxID=2817058 RepID=UPI001FFC4E46|nr:hypothetical protein [Methylobacterium sp. 37f]MCK2056676.1 hypothetical protein [Methylobacterium sp. 37f]